MTKALNFCVSIYMRPKHPEHLLISFHQACDKITGSGIMQVNSKTIFGPGSK